MCYWRLPQPFFFPKKAQTWVATATEVSALGVFQTVRYLAPSVLVPRVSTHSLGPGFGRQPNNQALGMGNRYHLAFASCVPSVPAGPLHGGLPFPGALPGEQLQHLCLGRASQPSLRAPVVRGPQQAGQSQAGLQPPCPAPACLHTLPAPLLAASAP